MLFVLPNLTSSFVDIEDGRFILKGEPTPKDRKTFEKWRAEVKAERREVEEAPFLFE